jgi:catechol 2,3-dioxygenase-like lactoylglutathione lyase family enzyme
MTVRRMDHVCIVVEDLAAAIAFFTALGLEPQDEMTVDGAVVDRINGLDGVRSRIAFLRTPDGHSQIELAKYESPAYTGGAEDAPPNAPGLRHITFAVDDVDATLAALRAEGAELVGELAQYESSYKLCYVRGPAGIIVELGEKIG